MIKRYASHFLFIPHYGYLKQYVVEVDNGYVVRIFPLTEEMEDVEWLPGAIVLLIEEELKRFNSGEIIVEFTLNLLILPIPLINSSCGMIPVYFPCFDIKRMLPVSGTRHILLK